MTQRQRDDGPSAGVILSAYAFLGVIAVGAFCVLAAVLFGVAALAGGADR